MRVTILVLLVVVFASCVRNKSGQVNNVNVESSTQSVSKNVFEVAEVLQTSNYTYLNVKENGEERWVAVTRMEAKVGDVLYYDEALQMKDFESKELERTFDVIYFINKVSTLPMAEKKMDMGAMHQGKPKTGKSDITMEKSEGELTLEEVFANAEKYSKEEFTIKGKP